MSSENIMTAVHAANIGVPVDTDPGKQKMFLNACGKPFYSLGEAVVDVAFLDNPFKVWRNCRFSVMDQCAVHLIIGDPLLRATETLTKFRHRLKKLETSLLDRMWKLCYIDVPLRQLRCLLGGGTALASADTGSDVDLVSLDYALHRGWEVHALSEAAGRLQLADGSVERLSGFVNTSFSIADFQSGKRFYVLDGLRCDALLCGETLDDLDAFNTLNEEFVEYDSNTYMNICHNMNWEGTVSRRKDQILQEYFPEQSAKQLLRHKLNWTHGRPVSSSRNVQGWKQAFDLALHQLDDREVTARVQASQAMLCLTGADLQRAQRWDQDRQEQHKKLATKIKQNRDKFLGVGTASTS